MLLFYNFNFDLLYAEKGVIQSSWTLYFNKIGTFEAHFPITSNLLKILSENRYLVVREADKTAIVIGYEAGKDLIVYGRTPNWILTKRIAPTQESVSEAAAVICKNLLESTMSDVTNFEVAATSTTQNVTIERNSLTTVYDAVSDCLSLADLGHELCFDTKNRKWIFKFLKQETVPLLISESNKNAYDTVINEDILDLANCGYYGDDGFISGEETGIYKWEAILNGESEEEASISLTKYKNNGRVTLSSKNISFGVDYKLGDIVRIQITKGSIRTTLNKYISGVSIDSKDGVVKESPIFEEVGGIE